MSPIAKMKTSTADNRGHAIVGQHGNVQECTVADEGMGLTYEKKGKRWATMRPVQSDSDKGGTAMSSPREDGGNKGKKKSMRITPNSKKKSRRPNSESDYKATNQGDIDDDSSDVQELSQSLKQKKVLSEKREYTAEECRRQLNLLSHPSKRSPIAMSEDIFHTSYRLPSDGTNPHRLRMEKDVPLADVEALFGEEKGQNGFLVTKRLTPALRKEVESLYYQIYQKTHASINVGKELAMGWTL